MAGVGQPAGSSVVKGVAARMNPAMRSMPRDIRNPRVRCGSPSLALLLPLSWPFALCCSPQPFDLRCTLPEPRRSCYWAAQWSTTGQ